MQQNTTRRIARRHACDIPVTACTTVQVRQARIVDLSRHGMQIACDTPYDAGTMIHIDHDGEYAWGIVAWTEIDRMGVKLLAPLSCATRLGALMTKIEADHRAMADAENKGQCLAGPTRAVFGQRIA